jgi:dipeptide/tripeptide permease
MLQFQTGKLHRRTLHSVLIDVNCLCVRSRKFPKAVMFIIGNEFCERVTYLFFSYTMKFSYYGLRAVLPFYMLSFPGVDEGRATTLMALFTTIAYFFPLFGGILSDSYLG